MCSTSQSPHFHSSSNGSSSSSNKNNYGDNHTCSIPSDSSDCHNHSSMDGSNSHFHLGSRKTYHTGTKLTGSSCDVSEDAMAALSSPSNGFSHRCNGTTHAYSLSPPSVHKTTDRKNLSVPSIQLEPAIGDRSFRNNLDSEFSDELDEKLKDLLNDFEKPATSSDTTSSDYVTLPCRYTKQASDTHERMTSLCHDAEDGDDMVTREKDLGTALKWIRQEILQMKEQDKSLLKQFIELRASILQLRCLYDMHGSCSDVSSLDGSTYSLNEPAKSPRLRRIVLEGDCFLKPSYSLPNSPRVARFKWRSDEII